MAALNIVRRDLLRYLRNPGRTALLFALPLVMSAIFALVFFLRFRTGKWKRIDLLGRNEPSAV